MSKVCTELALAAYAHMQGMPIEQASETRSKGPIVYEFVFNVDDAKWAKMKQEFFNSESQRFDNSVRQLKRMSRDGC